MQVVRESPFFLTCLHCTRQLLRSEGWRDKEEEEEERQRVVSRKKDRE